MFPSKTTPGIAHQADYERYGYDANGNRTSLRKRDGSVLVYHYDALNRMKGTELSERCNEGIWTLLKKPGSKRARRVEGSIVRIPVAPRKVAYGLVLREPLVAVFNRQFDEEETLDLPTLIDTPIAFELMVMNYAITRGRWVVVGRVPIPDHLRAPPAFCKQDQISGKLSIYQTLEELAPHYERDATPDECQGLETAAVWDPEHVEDRIRDHFAGRSNIWVEQLRIHPSTPEGTRPN